MTNAEALAKYEEMIAFFSNRVLPDPDHEPVRFAYYVKLFRYCTEKQPTEVKNG